MIQSLHFILMSQVDLLANEVIEEVLRERVNSYVAQKKPKDFWLLISPEFIRNQIFLKHIRETNFYKQQKTNLLPFLSHYEFFAAVVSSNKEFITWLALRLGYFETLDDNSHIEKTKNSYKSNGIIGSLELKPFQLSLALNSNPNYLHPNFIVAKYFSNISSIYDPSYSKYLISVS